MTPVTGDPTDHAQEMKKKRLINNNLFGYSKNVETKKCYQEKDKNFLRVNIY